MNQFEGSFTIDIQTYVSVQNFFESAYIRSDPYMIYANNSTKMLRAEAVLSILMTKYIKSWKSTCSMSRWRNRHILSLADNTGRVRSVQSWSWVVNLLQVLHLFLWFLTSLFTGGPFVKSFNEINGGPVTFLIRAIPFKRVRGGLTGKF